MFIWFKVKDEITIKMIYTEKKKKKAGKFFPAFLKIRIYYFVITNLND